MVMISLDCLTLTDTDPVAAIEAAGAARFDLVSLWLSDRAAYPRAVVTPMLEAEVAAALARCGIGLGMIEAFELSTADAVRGYREPFERGARLGAGRVLVYHGSAERSAAVELLALAAEQADELGLELLLEPVAMGGTRTLAEGASLISDAGCNARLLCDLWHLVRAGGGPEDLRAISPDMIGYVQVNDGLPTIPEADLIAEAMCERLYPGAGAFPLAELLALLPRKVPWGVECPSVRRARAGFSPASQALEAHAAMQRVLGQSA